MGGRGKRHAAAAFTALTLAILAAHAGSAVAMRAVAAPCTGPSAPGSVSATAGANRATVSWTAANGNGSSITGYIVRAATGPNAGESVSTNGSGTHAVLGSLGGGKAATFSVAAVSTCATGPGAATKAVTPTGAATTFVTAVHADGPVAEYRLGDQSGTIMTDSSGKAADGTYSGQETLAQPGALPNDPDTSTALPNCCSGIGSATATLPFFNGARTVEAWVNTTYSGSVPEVIASYGANGNNEGFTISILANSINVDPGGDYHAIPTPRPLNDGQWHLIDVTSNGTTASAYLDGQLVGTATFHTAMDTLAGPLTAAASSIGGNYTVWRGGLEEVSVFPAALSATRVAAHFAVSGYSRPTASHVVSVGSGGPNTVQVSWGHATASNTPVLGYLVSVTSGPNKGETTAVSADATAAALGGLEPATQNFQVVAVDAYGDGPAVATGTFAVTGSSTPYAGTVLADHPAAFYRLDDTTASILADSSGNGTNGSYVASNVTQGIVGAIPGDPGTAVSDQALKTGYATANTSLPLYNSARSVEFWLQTTTSESETILSWGQNAQDEAFAVEEVSATELAVDGGSDQHVFPTPYPLDDGAWHMVTVTYDGDTITVYLDGRAIGTSHFAASLDTLPASPLLYVGSLFNTGAAGLYDTNLDDLSIYPSALTAARVAAHFTASGYSRPSSPGSPKATAGANRATVSWTAPAAGNAPITAYLVTALKGTSRVNSVTVPASANSAVVGGLQGGTSCTFTVQAINSYGYGAAATTSAVSPTGKSATYDSTVLSDSPSAFYRLGDTTTVSMADSSGHGGNGYYVASNVTQGVAGAIPGDPSTALGDQGRGSGYGVANASLPTTNSARSVEFWLQSTTGENGTFLSWGQNGMDNAFAVEEVSATELAVDGSGDQRVFLTPYPLNDGVWHMVTVTYDGTTITVYLDGRAIGDAGFRHPLETLSGGPLFIGSFFGSNALTNTNLDDMSIYPSALTAAQVAGQFATTGYTAATPGSPKATAGANQATVSWTAPAAGPAPIEGYLVTALKGTVKVNSVSVAASATKAVIGGLQGGASYKFTVQAINSYGYGAAATTAAVSPTGKTATYDSTVLSDSPSVFYRFGDTATVSMADSSGHGANGYYVASNVTQGVAGAIPGDPSTAVGDRQKGSGYGTAHPALPLYNSARSVDFWMQSTTSEYAGFLSWGQASGDEGFAVDEYLPTELVVDAAGDTQFFPTPYLLDDGAWHMVTVTYDGSTLTVYLDGHAIGTGRFQHQLDTLPGPLSIGNSFGNGGLINTNLDDVSIYPTALSAAQVAAQFATTGYTAAAPVSPKATAGANRATVSWTAPAAGPAPIEGYRVTAVKGSSDVNSVAVPASTTTAVVGGLQGGTSYKFKVQAINSHGYGTAATTAAVTPTGATTTYASTVLADGPAVYYRLGDTTTGPGSMTDSSGHGDDGYYNAGKVTLGVTGAISGDPDTAVAGEGIFVGVADAANLPLYNQPRTVEAWIKPGNSNQQYLTGWGVEGAGEGFHVAADPSHVYVQGGQDALTFPTSTNLDDGGWHFIAATSPEPR